MQREQTTTEISRAADAVDERPAAASHSRLDTAVFVLLCIVPIFANLAYGAVETWAFGFISLLTGAIVLLWLADAWRRGELRPDTSLLPLPLVGLALIGLVQLLPLGAGAPSELLSVPAAASLSLDPYATRIAVVQLVIYAVFFVAARAFISDHRRLQKTVTVVVVFASAMAFFGILQRLANPEGIYGWRPTPQAIPFASFVNQHHFAAFMEMTIGLTLALLVGRGTGKDKRLLLVIAVVLMGIAILLTGSRGGVLSLFGVLGFLFVSNFFRRRESEDDGPTDDKRARFRRNLSLVGGGLALVVILFGAVFLLGANDSLLRGVGLTAQEDVSSGRTHFWWVAWQIFKDYPLIGAGLDAFGTAFPRYDTWNGALRVEQAHNDYLQILADAGVLGFACVAAFVFLLFKNSLAVIAAAHDRFRRSVAIGALAGSFGILLHSFFDFPLRTPANAFFFLVMVVLATAPIHSPKHKKR